MKKLTSLLKSLRYLPEVNPEDDFRKRAKSTLLERLSKGKTYGKQKTAKKLTKKS